MPGKSKILAGALLGCAAGDSIGLPYEGLSRDRCSRILHLPLEHRFVFGRGMVSDDTDHTIFAAQSMIAAGDDERIFARSLAWRLRWWLLCLPAGIGMATLKSIVRLWLGFSPARSGVFSAGNGPAMRSAIIGAYYCRDAIQRRAFLEASTRLTHTDPKALAAAMAVAEIAARLASGEWTSRPSIEDLRSAISTCADSPEWTAAVPAICDACASASSTLEIAFSYGGKSGVSGYSLHSVPFAIVCWYRRFGDFRATIEAVCEAGGDTDTTAAIAGALGGITCGEAGIPRQWLAHLADWPHSTRYLRSLASTLADPSQPARIAFSPWLFLRGLVFTTLVLAHGFRRLLPPY